LKQKWLLLMAFFPLLISWFHNMTLFALNGFLFYSLPLATVAVWIWVGWRYAHSGLRFCWSFLAANWFVLLSLPVLIWQFWFVDDAARSMGLAVMSQCTSIFSPLVAPLAIRLGPDPTSAGTVTYIAMIALSALLFLILFTAGYLAGKRSLRGRGSAA
jgi:hypothetical protein